MYVNLLLGLQPGQPKTPNYLAELALNHLPPERTTLRKTKVLTQLLKGRVVFVSSGRTRVGDFVPRQLKEQNSYMFFLTALQFFSPQCAADLYDSVSCRR